jgi:hypothetical protein
MLGASLGLPLCVTALLLWCCEVFGATLGASLGSVSEEAALLLVGFILLLLLDDVGSLGEITFMDRTSYDSPGRCVHFVVDLCGLFCVEYSPFRLSATPVSVFFASPLVVADDRTDSTDEVVADIADEVAF